MNQTFKNRNSRKVSYAICWLALNIFLIEENTLLAVTTECHVSEVKRDKA